MQNTISIIIDLKRESYQNNIAQQNDDVLLNIDVHEDGKIKSLTGATINLSYVNANNTVSIIGANSIVVSGNNIKITCPRDCTRSAGIAKMKLTIVSDSKQVSTFPISLTVVADVLNGQEISKNVATILEGLTEKNLQCTETLDSMNTWLETHHINEIEGSISSLDSRLDVVEGTTIGGVNLLTGSGFKKANFTDNYWAISPDVVVQATVASEISGYSNANMISFKIPTGYTAAAIVQNYRGYVAVSILDKTKTYTMSVWAKASVEGGTLQLSTGTGSNVTFLKEIPLATTWKRYCVTFKGNGDNKVVLRVCKSSNDPTFYIAMPKLEEGDKITSYSPAPEDLQDKLYISDTNTSMVLALGEAFTTIDSVTIGQDGKLTKNTKTVTLPLPSESLTSTSTNVALSSAGAKALNDKMPVAYGNVAEAGFSMPNLSVKMGTVVLDKAAGVPTVINFQQAFSSVCYSVVVGLADSCDPKAGGVIVSNWTKTGFTLTSGQAALSRRYTWVAMGN